MYPEVDDKCDRCLNPQGHLSHISCLCPEFYHFWTGDCNTMPITSKPPSIDCYLWDVRVRLINEYFAKGKISFSSHMLLNPPSVLQWLKDNVPFLKLEKNVRNLK